MEAWGEGRSEQLGFNSDSSDLAVKRHSFLLSSIWRQVIEPL